jgi:hypothetical protein
MSRFRHNPVFASVLTLVGLCALGEGWCLYDRAVALRAAEVKLANKEGELRAMADTVPAPTREIANQIKADVARTENALAAMRAELRGRGPPAEVLARSKVPEKRVDAFFDLSTFVDQTRAQAKRLGVTLRPDERFGFAAYANEGPEAGLIAPVFRQRLVAQYLIETLLEARPKALLAVQRERPLRKSERDALAAAAAGGPAPEPAAAAAVPDDGPSADLLEPEPHDRARPPGAVETTAFRLTFTGQTATLRALLNKLAGFELPIVVRSVEVEPAPEETPAAAEAAAGPPAASVVLTADGVVSGRPPAPVPLIAQPVSKFTVTVEFIELAPVADAVAADPKPSSE